MFPHACMAGFQQWELWWGPEWSESMSCPVPVAAESSHLWSQCGWPSCTTAAARQRIPQHPGSDIFQEDQQQLQAGDGQGTLLGRQMAGERAAEMQSWRCTLRRMSFMSKGDILWPVSDPHWARISLRNCGCGWPAPGQQQSWGIVVMGDQCWRRNHPEGLWSPGKPVRSTKEWGKPIRMSDEQRNPSKKHGRAANQKHYIPSLSLQSCSL